jgi:hypothetical protein
VVPTAKSKTTETASDTLSDVVDDKYYDVLVSEGFEYKRVKFGVISKTHVSGEFLKDLMSSDHKDKISAYVERT